MKVRLTLSILVLAAALTACSAYTTPDPGSGGRYPVHAGETKKFSVMSLLANDGLEAMSKPAGRGKPTDVTLPSTLSDEDATLTIDLTKSNNGQNGLNVVTDGTITYTAPDDLRGADSFEYRVCLHQATNGCVNGTVHVDVSEPVVATTTTTERRRDRSEPAPADTDADDDGVDDDTDNCPADPNAGQDDLDADLEGDACDADDDGDGTDDGIDPCPADPLDACGGGGGPGGDADGDLIPDGIDNCPFVHNVLQEDADADMVGAACDADDGDPFVS